VDIDAMPGPVVSCAHESPGNVIRIFTRVSAFLFLFLLYR
jgi:hypothetical protein